MPLYLYRCSSNHITETVHGMGEVVQVACATCGAATRRMFTAPAVKQSSFIEPSPAIRTFLQTTSARREQYLAKKAARGK